MITKQAAGRTLAAMGCAGAMAVLGAGCAASTGSSSMAADSAGTATPTPGSAPGGTATPTPTASTGASSPTPAAAAATAFSRCHTADLSGAFTVVAGSEGAGNIVYNIKLTNTSARTCTIYGHPGLLLLNSHHAGLPTHVQWNSMTAVRLLTLKPGQSASASARFSPDVAGTGDSAAPGAACEPTADYTEITPPDETAHLIVPVKPATPVCEAGSMSVSAFVAGGSGPGEG